MHSHYRNIVRYSIIYLDICIFLVSKTNKDSWNRGEATFGVDPHLKNGPRQAVTVGDAAWLGWILHGIE